MPIEIVGANNAIRALADFSPDLARATETRLYEALSPMVRKARGFLPASAPLSNWQDKGQSAMGQKYRRFPLYNAISAKRGIDYTITPSKPNRKGWVTLAAIYNSDPAGVIYETAGRKNPNGQKPAKRQWSYTQQRWVYDSSKKFSHSLNPNAGKQFIGSLGALYNAFPRPVGKRGRSSRKNKGRVIFRAWAEDGGKTNSLVLSAIDDAVTQFYDGLRKKVA
jgi:hypothetical protein